MKNVLRSLTVLVGGFGVFGAAHAAIIISEVDSAGSSNTSPSTYAFDWFELTNTGSVAVDITGWKVDDDSGNAGLATNAFTLTGVTLIQPGQSAVFGEGGSLANFANTWFSAAHPQPANFLFGSYSGSGLGLSTGGDAVNIFDSSGARVTWVTFGAPTAGRTFDNAAGVGGGGVLGTASTVGVNGAYAGLDGRIGSPGSISAVPLPAGVWLLGSGLGLLGGAIRRRAAA